MLPRRDNRGPYGRCCHKRAHHHSHFHLPSPFGVGTVQAFDGPARCGIFPTDFSSTMPSADCPSAIARLAARPLRVAKCVCVPVAGFAACPSPTRRAEALVSRPASSPALFSQNLGLSRGSPWLLSMRNCRVYVWRRIGNRDFRLCCTLVPVPAASYPPRGCQSSSLHCAFSPHLRLRPLPGHRYRLSPCPWLPFAVT